MEDDERTGPTGQLDPKNQPTGMYIPITPAEWSALGTVVNATVNAAKSAVDLARGRKAQAAHPLEVAVLRSETGDGEYQLEFSLKNCISHGVYVEDVSLIEPGGSSHIRSLGYSVQDHAARPKTSFGLDDPELPLDVPPFAPKLIRPGDTLNLVVRIPPDSKLWFDRATLGIARATISILSADESTTVEWGFRIRHR